MPTKQKRTRILPATPPVLEDDDPTVLPMTPGEEEAYGEINRIMEQLGDEEAKVVLRRRSNNGLLHHVGVMSAVDFDIERVIKDYGGGRYEASFYQGKRKAGNVTFDIDPAIPARLPSVEEKEVPLQPTQDIYARGPFLGGELSALREVMSRQADLLNQLIVNLATGGNGKREETSQSAIDLALKMVEAINSRTPVHDTPVSELKEMFMAGIETAKAAEGGDSYWPVLEKFAGPVAQVLQHAVDRERGGAPNRTLAAPARSAAAVAAAPAPPPPQEIPVGPSWIIHLRPHLPTLLSWARAGKDPELYAEVILDNLEQGAILELQAAAQDDQFVDKTLAVLPMFRPYSAWASAILTNIKQLVLAPPEQEGGDDGGGGGDG